MANQKNHDLSNLNVLELWWFRCWIDMKEFKKEDTDELLESEVREDLEQYLETLDEKGKLEKVVEAVNQENPKMCSLIFGGIKKEEKKKKTVKKNVTGLSPKQTILVKRIRNLVNKGVKPIRAKHLVTKKMNSFTIGALVTTLIEKSVITTAYIEGTKNKEIILSKNYC